MTDCPGYEVVIATYCRAERLGESLRSLALQTAPPAMVHIVDASPDEDSAGVAREYARQLPIRYEKSSVASAARQRNAAARHLTLPFVAFMDDDVVLDAELFEVLLQVLADDAGEKVGGIAPRMRGFSHKRPGGLLKWYYRLQAGFDHPHYGGLMFGAAVNCLPCYAEEQGDVCGGNWLSSTVVLYRTPVFQQHLFPAFDGYSWMEDAYLSGMIAKSHRLLWHTKVSYDHFPSISPAKRDRVALARMRNRHHALIAKEVLGLSPRQRITKMWLRCLFDSLHLLRARPPGWPGEIRGIWTS